MIVGNDEEEPEEGEERDQPGPRRQSLAHAQLREPAPEGAGSGATSTRDAVAAMVPNELAMSVPTQASATIGPQLSVRTCVGGGDLGGARELDLADQLGRRQVLLGMSAVTLPVAASVCVAGRDGAALEVAEGALVGQDVLDPQLAAGSGAASP